MLGLTHQPAIELAARLVRDRSGRPDPSLLLRQRLHGRRGRTQDRVPVLGPAGGPGGPPADRLTSACERPTTATRSAPSRSAGSTCSTRGTRPSCSTPGRSTPAISHSSTRVLEAHGDRVAAMIVEPLVQGAAGMLVHPAGLPAGRARALRRARRSADLRRGRHRLRSDGADVRLRARGRPARPAVRRQGPDRRLHAAGGDARDRADLRGLPRRPRGVPDLLPRPHLHRQPARLRRGPRDARRVRRGADARAPRPEDRAARAAAGRPRPAAALRCRDPPVRVHGRESSSPGSGRAIEWATRSRSRRVAAARSSARSATSSS